MSSPYGDAMNLGAMHLLLLHFTDRIEWEEDEDMTAELAGQVFEYALSAFASTDWIHGRKLRYERITQLDSSQWLKINSELFRDRSFRELKTDDDALALFFRFTRNQKQVLDFLRSLRKLQRGIPITAEARGRVLANCTLASQLIGELASAAHFWEVRQDDDD